MWNKPTLSPLTPLATDKNSPFTINSTSLVLTLRKTSVMLLTLFSIRHLLVGLTLAQWATAIAQLISLPLPFCGSLVRIPRTTYSIHIFVKGIGT